jgi:GDP-L-fucose synthase
MYALSDKKIYVAGHRGMVGAAAIRKLQSHGADRLVYRPSTELDLRDQQATDRFFALEKPDVVVFAAARVGGIHANMTYPANFIYDNLAMAVNSIHAAYQNGCERFLYLGSTCIYPRDAPQPMQEQCLLTGPLEKTNEAYALAKITGLKLCEFYRQQYGVTFHSAMPTNLYGPGDNYHPENSHVLPALIRKFHEATVNGQDEVTIWGTGRPRREFLHVDDLADAIVFLLQIDSPPDLVNVGTGKDISIQELAELVADCVGFQGRISNDLSKPDGTPQKKTDVGLIAQLGWQAKIGLRNGIAQTYRDFLTETEQQSVREVVM